MLELKNIVKIYGENTALPVKALKGVSLTFGEAEFVSVLGPSGCGKTTMLNIIGGLDRYTEGDLIINGTSTKDYTDRDWDAYRNHSIGFVFQSYNLIPHQTVIKNVELALTLSGVDKETRKRRATQALELVGLKDQINKLPNQLSGGQMQRVAIARAIVNDPEIILADEPTGALDSATSVQVMEILKDLSKTKLVIMVTHNGELAEKYSTRIVNLSDGLITDDTAKSAPEKPVKPVSDKSEKNRKKEKKPSMGLLTAFSLSLNNLMTKKGRTILTAFAGSIGIIGIALILSLSAGFNAYINNVQRDTLSNYPLTISQESFDTTAALGGMMPNSANAQNLVKYPTDEEVTSQDTIENLFDTYALSFGTNDLKSFKKYLDENADYSYISAIQYSYDLNEKLYFKSGDNYRQLWPVVLPPVSEMLPGVETEDFDSYYQFFREFVMERQGLTSEIIDNQTLLDSQYDVLKGSWPAAADEMVIVVDRYNRINDMSLFMMGLMNERDLAYVFQKLLLNMTGQLDGLSEEEIDEKVSQALIAIYGEDGQTHRSAKSYTFDELMALEYNIVLPVDTYKQTGEVKTVNEKDFPLWEKMTDEEITSYMQTHGGSVLTGGTKLKISGIVRLKETATTGSLTTHLCYSSALTKLLTEKINNSPVVKQHLNDAVVTNSSGFTTYWSVFPLAEWKPIDLSDHLANSSKLGVIDEESPTSISIYPVSFESKDKVVALIEKYNEDNPGIKYNDTIGLMMSSITDIINAVTYVLIAFVSISLIVSSIMISVITRISVMERTKEIGVLRSMGASKRDISTVFNAETAIIGFTAGLLGIIITLLLNIPVSIIIHSLTGLAGLAALPIWGGFALVGISTLLTIIAGLIPAMKASKQDPVVALRSE